MTCASCSAENREGLKFCVQCGVQLALKYRCPVSRTEGFDTADLKDAKALLDELGR